jgi:hypothetical protein
LLVGVLAGEEFVGGCGVFVLVLEVVLAAFEVIDHLLLLCLFIRLADLYEIEVEIMGDFEIV